MIITYHHVDTQPGFVTVAAADLEAHLSWIHDQGFVVDIDTYLKQVLAGYDSTRMMTITFDDAYKSFADLALPLLEKYEIPATLFVPVGHIGGINQWDIPIYGVAHPILDWDDLADLARHPLVTIGSHSMSHQSLKQLPPDTLADEMRQSKKLLEDKLGVDVYHFSFPYGQIRHIPADSSRMLTDAGYKSACSNRYGRVNRPADRFMLRRIHINPEDDLNAFTAKCAHRNLLKELKQLARDLVR